MWQMRNLVYAIPGLLSLIGVVIAVFGVRTLIQARASASWPATNGRITRAEVARCMGGSSGDTSSSPQDVFSPEIRYVYRVKGREYTGTHIYSGDGVKSDYAYAFAYIQRYTVGRELPVYYDPHDPGSSLLQPGVSRRSFIALTFGLGFAAFGAWFCLLYWLMSE